MIDNSRTESYANRRKLRKKGLKKYVIKQNISKNDLREVTRLQNMSLEEFKKISILQNIKNHDKLSKEDLFYTLLRSEKDPIESNYIKYITSDANDEIKDKVNNIRIVLARLGYIRSKNDRKIIKKDLYEIDKKKRPTKPQKERAYRYLIELANYLDKKQEHKHIDRDDLDYFGIIDIENLFFNIDDSKYYKPQLVKSLFNNNYEYHEIRGDRNNNLLINQYLYMIIRYFTELINKKQGIIAMSTKSN